MKFHFVTCEQQVTNTPVAVIFARDEEGNRHIIRKGNMPVYFYAPEHPQIADQQLASKILSVKPGYKSIFGKDLFKIKVAQPNDVYTMKKVLEDLHEADIPWRKRVMIDLGVKDGFEMDPKTKEITPCNASKIPLRTWVIDIEVINSNGVPTWKQPYYPVVCIVVYDSFTDEYYEFTMKRDNEITMFEKFARFMQEHDPDIITGWNIDFDVSYIIGRMEHLRKYFAAMLSPIKKAYVRESRDVANKPIYTNITIAGRVIFDGLNAYKSYKNPSGRLNSYNLKAVTKMELGYDYEDFGAQTTKIWNEDPDKIIKYCKEDVKATWGIIKKNNLIDLYGAICSISGVTMDKATSKEAITDSYLMRISGDRILPSRHTSTNSLQKENAGEGSELKGGLVLEPKTGMQTNIACFDAAGLYPSIMIGFNVSPECKDKNGSIKVKDDRGIEYSFVSKEEKPGIVPQICEDFRNIRIQSKKYKTNAAKEYGEDSAEYERAHQYDAAVKTVMNGVYGVVGNPAFRLFDLDCANTVTAVGRNIINGLSGELEKQEFPTVYGDTDSVFVSVSEFKNVTHVKEIIKKFLDSELSKMGVPNGAIDVQFEKYFTRLLFKRRQIRKNTWIPVKKKYVGYMTYNDDHECDSLFIRGFETRRSDTSKILNEKMMKFFELVVQQDNLQAGIDLIKALKDNFNSIDPYEIAVPRTLHKEVENSPWFRGMRYAKENCGYKFDEDTAPRLLYVKRIAGGHPPTDAFCIQEGMKVPPWVEIDYDVMFEKVIKKKFYPIFHELEVDWLTTFENISQLDEWF